MSNSPHKDKIVSDDLRYTDWENPNPLYPRTLDAGDFATLMKSKKLFARKFDEHSLELLALIDREVGAHQSCESAEAAAS
jgi:hypothetical protein